MCQGVCLSDPDEQGEKPGIKVNIKLGFSFDSHTQKISVD